MSTSTNVDVAKKAYADFQRGDIDSILAILTEDIEWITPGEGTPVSGRRRGKAEVTGFFRAVADTWNFSSFEPREYLASGDSLAVVGNYTATAKSTGKTLSSDWVMLWNFRDGKVSRFQEFTDTQAIDAALNARSAAHGA